MSAARRPWYRISFALSTELTDASLAPDRMTLSSSSSIARVFCTPQNSFAIERLVFDAIQWDVQYSRWYARPTILGARSNGA